MFGIGKKKKELTRLREESKKQIAETMKIATRSRELEAMVKILSALQYIKPSQNQSIDYRLGWRDAMKKFVSILVEINEETEKAQANNDNQT